jgi:transposase
MQLSYKTPIWLYPTPVDFRNQIDGLALLIADQLSLNPGSGELFIFYNRTGDKVKLLWYDRNGFWLCYKRLEKGRFSFPKKLNDAMELTRDQLSWLLSGLVWMKTSLLPTHEATHFF